MPFKKQFSTNEIHGVALFDSKRRQQNGWVSWSISKKNAMIYISTDVQRTYWIGSLEGRSASFKIKFIDKTHTIRVQSYKIVFKYPLDYLKIKEAFIRYKYMDADSSLIQFINRNGV